MRKRIIGMVTMLLLILSLLPVMTTDVSAKESVNPILVVSAKTSGDKAVKLSWIKVSGADKYVVYGARCGKKNVKIATVKKTSCTVKKIGGKKLDAHKDYNFYVVAYKGKKQLVKSDMIRFITAGTQGKYANVTKITAAKKSIGLKQGKSTTLSYKTVLPKGKKHVKVTKAYKVKTRFYSDNTKVATVTSKGKLKAIAAGKANIYIQDMNGKYCTVKVTVKGITTPTPTSEPTATPAPTGEPTATPTPVPTYTVTFDVQGKGTAPAPLTDVKSAATITEPEMAQTEDGYVVEGWYKEAACKNEWDFTKDVVKENTTLYAKWIYAGLCFTAEEANSKIKLTQYMAPNPISLQCSADGKTWNDYTIGNDIILANAGDKVWFKATTVNNGFSESEIIQYRFAMEGKIAASGNIMSLLDETCKSTKIPSAYCFTQLFWNCTSLTSAPALPATELAERCYGAMFGGCTSLTSAPALPATTLAKWCYSYMFNGCTSLTSAPELKATKLESYCCEYMFNGCTSLTSAPELNAMALADHCYVYMFNGCTSLTSAPELKATKLAGACYDCMFSDCTSLTSAPELKATKLESYCYQYMFYGCTSLTSVKMSATDISAENSLVNWLEDAGTAAEGTKHVYVANEDMKGMIKPYLPEKWEAVCTQ